MEAAAVRTNTALGRTKSFIPQGRRALVSVTDPWGILGREPEPPDPLLLFFSLRTEGKRVNT